MYQVDKKKCLKKKVCLQSWKFMDNVDKVKPFIETFWKETVAK